MITKIFLKFRDISTTLKMYVRRTMSYVSLINTGMILFLFISNLEKYNIDINLRIWLLPFMVIGFMAIVTFGYVEDKLGFFKEEQRMAQSRSPYFRQILNRLEIMDNKIEEINNAINNSDRT